MSLFDSLSGGAYTRANKNNQQAIATGLAQGTQALNNTFGQGLAYLVQGSDPNALSSLTQGYGQARQDIGSQYNETQSRLGALGDLYTPMAQGGQQAFDRFLNASGANGSAGSAQAQADFTASPGYQFSLDNALGAVQRTAAARGGLAGGNATADLLKTATGLANQQFQQYTDNLRNASQYYGQGVQGQAGALGQQANASQAYGSQLGALGTGLGSGQATIYGQGANLEAQYGAQYANLINGATGRMVDSNNNLAKGQTQASANALGALAGVGTSLLGGFGGAGGLAGLFKTGSNGFSSLGRSGENALADAVGFNPFNFA